MNHSEVPGALEEFQSSLGCHEEGNLVKASCLGDKKCHLCLFPRALSEGAWQSLYTVHCGILKGEIKVTVCSRGVRPRLPSSPPGSSSLARDHRLIIRQALGEHMDGASPPLCPMSLIPTGRERLFQSPLSCSGHSSLP